MVSGIMDRKHIDEMNNFLNIKNMGFKINSNSEAHT